eukprot:TRINITY_DN52088_c0_g1_i1.p1 TRINITY_DN52088_c0_g1~~TRINITY_DN52088_c0_g1_i1.p1  ORF type:complete len:124 (-),score=20.68 TRINITY_DN52088_c0_g1_i1:209-580(-)
MTRAALQIQESSYQRLSGDENKSSQQSASCWEGVRYAFDREWASKSRSEKLFIVGTWMLKLFVVVSLYLTTHDAQHRISDVTTQLATIHRQYAQAVGQVLTLSTTSADPSVYFKTPQPPSTTL